jgi:hypothetical protein
VGGRERERERGERREKRERERERVCVDRVNTGMVGLVWTDVPRAVIIVLLLFLQKQNLDMLSHAPEKAHKFERGGGGGGGQRESRPEECAEIARVYVEKFDIITT